LKRGEAPLIRPKILEEFVFKGLATFDPPNMGKFKRGRQPPLSTLPLSRGRGKRFYKGGSASL
jgi:hypothetical protein